MLKDTYRFGIEEEYFLVDAKTKSIVTTRPPRFLQDLKEVLGDRVSGEMLQAQMEVSTSPHTDMNTASAELKHLRQATARIASEHGLAIVAAGTHPTAIWNLAQQSPGERYDAVMHDLQIIGQRNMLCGMHVHVELPDAEDRVDVMYRMLPYLPLFIALSTSSPFWQSHCTGLKGYRLAAYDELPRTGVPELFRTREEFDSYIAALTHSGVIEDSSYVWWAIRPSLKLPTLELRAPDSCTFVDDSVAIAALYRALARQLVRNPLHNRTITAVDRALIVENKWRAQRYGIQGTFATGNGDGAVSVADMLEQVLEIVMPHAEALGCDRHVRHCRAIVGGGTSADAQLAVYASHEKNEGCELALTAVTDWLATATLQ
ncbi:MAG: carboxylate-amine ligase [Xanthobacteraceae bacterium]